MTMLEPTSIQRFFPRITFSIHEEPPEEEIIFFFEPEIVKEDNGFHDWFGIDPSYGFHIYCDEELANILQYKCDNHVVNTMST